ncbi:hypothetical protein [Pseudomonas aeruginosa]|uniref:hypothetical protein n=1 Tax=Pseudomonas aeruginosa TaxID=287 RepID=UPI000A991DAA|nr:hypothetical protein [Pseudomonas aeruginosa]
MNKANECTCPSGDGSLVHPCPAHPAVEQAGGDRWDALQSIMEWTAAENIPDDRKLCLIRNAARAALAQPSQSQYEASFEEWLANELEGEDGHPVPAAVCDIALARRAFNHWPKLEQPAKVGGVRFSAGVSSRLVVEAAQRLYEFESTPEKEAERIERLQAFREQCFEPLGTEFSKVLSDNLPDLLSTAQAERPEFDESEREDMARIAFETAMANGISLDSFTFLSNSLAERYERIVGELRADRDSWAEQVEQRLADWDEMRKERDAALAKIAELDQALAEKDPFGAKLNRISEKLERCDALLAARAAQAGQVPQAWLDVQAERRRQITAEGWTPEHDDLYCAAELPRAAAAYILNGANDEAPAIWSFSAKWWKPRDARSNYVRAGALILAEIERLDRAAPGKEVGHE